MKTFRVYFSDGNQKLFEAPHIGAIVRKIADCYEVGAYGVTDIYKIEEITQEDKLMDIRSKVYDALAEIMMETCASEEDMDQAIEWFQIHFYETDAEMIEEEN